MRYIFIFILLSNIANARPVSYPDGWTIMQMNNWEQSRLHVHYSPNAKNSIGVVAENYNDEDRYNLKVQWNYLINRRNTKHSQRNLYLKTQAGIAHNDITEPNINIGIAGDWETRRYFTSYAANLEYADKLDNGSFHQKARIGIAPYVADYGSLHTWLMLQAEHHPEALDKDEQILITPMVRLFKGDYMAEMGVNNQGKAMFNWIVRF